MDTASLDDPVNSADLRAFVRAFIDATSDITGTPASLVLAVTARVLEREVRRRSDDMGEVWRLGRLLQAVRVQLDAAPRGDGPDEPGCEDRASSDG